MNTKLLKRIKAEERRLMKKKTRRVHRQVLGTGYPWFLRDVDELGYTKVMLMSGPNHEAGRKVVAIKFGDLGAYQKIKLIAEYVK